MVLQDYKIQDDGIWIPRKELIEWRDHYAKVSDKMKADWKKNNKFSYPFYVGKTEVMVDLLKMFENLEDN